VILFAGSAVYPLQTYAGTAGIGKTWASPEKELQGSFKGVLQFDQAQENFCNVSYDIKHGLVNKSDVISADNGMDYLFVRIDNKNSSQAWQLQLGYPADDLTYRVRLVSGNQVFENALHSPDTHSENSNFSNFGIIMEPNQNAKITSIPSENTFALPYYDKFLESIGNESYLVLGLPIEKRDYFLDVVVFDSEDDWIKSDTCGKKAIIPVSIDSAGQVQVGTIQLSDVIVSDVTENLPPYRQHVLGVVGSNIECAPGFLHVEKSSNDQPGCVKSTTKDKLIERGWAKTKYYAG